MKRVGIVLFQLLVTGTGLWYVFHDEQKRAQIADALRQADQTWMILVACLPRADAEKFPI